jgi:hypothetical protein
MIAPPVGGTSGGKTTDRKRLTVLHFTLEPTRLADF